MKRQILTALFLLLVFHVGNIFAQTKTVSEKIIFNKLNLGFCSQNQQDDFPTLNHEGDLLLDIFKSISSRNGEVEINGRSNQIIISDTRVKIKNFKDIVKMIDDSIDRSLSKNRCIKETEITLFLNQID